MILYLLVFATGLVVGAGLLWLAMQDQASPPPPAPKRITRRKSTSGVSGNDVLMAIMSQEMREPLERITGYAELLQEDAVFLEQNDFVPDLLRIKMSAEHVIHQLDDVIDLAAIAGGRLKPDLTDVDVTEVTDSVVRGVEPLIRRTLATLTVDVADDATYIRTDEDRLRRALDNLVRQVIGLAAQGKLVLSVRRDGDYALFTLTQDVLDLDPSQVQAMLIDMASGAPSTVESAHRAGLGLVTTREFARLLGGKLLIEPKSEGPGVDFIVRVRAH